MTEKEQKHIFENWLDQHKVLIFKVVRSFAFTMMDQDDLFQEIIIQVWRSIPKFRRESSVITWIFGIFTVLGVWESGKSVWQTVGILVFFVLGNYAAGWELNFYKARKRELEILQNKLEAETPGDRPS